MTRRRVLVTGASGGFGAALLERLARRDEVEIVAFDTVVPGRPVPGVEFFRGDVRDAHAVAGAMAGCDVVAHLAWIVRPVKDRARARSVDLGGTAAVLDAMARTGCGRLVFASSVTAYGAAPGAGSHREEDPLDEDQPFAYGAHKAIAERMIGDAGVEATIVRAAVVVGRRTDNSVRQVFAAPVLAGIRGEQGRVQVVHHDDVGRFYEQACLGGRTGVVNLAADDVLDLETVGEILGKPIWHLPAGVVEGFVRSSWRLGLGALDPDGFAAMRWIPLADTTRLREDWGFGCEYSTAAALADFRAALRGVVSLGRFELTWPPQVGRVARTGSQAAQ